MAIGQGSPSDEDSVLGELRQYTTDPERGREHFRRLAEDILGTEEAKGLACTGCEELIEVYVADEQSGHDVHQRYPAIWQHLLRCEDCLELYEFLTESLLSNSPEEIAPPRSIKVERLPPLAPVAAGQPWLTQFRSGATPKEFRLEVSFNPAYLQTLLVPSPLSLRNLTGLAQQRHLLLYETLQVEGTPVTVQLTASRSAMQVEQLTIQVQVTGIEPLATDLTARLTWADTTYAAHLDEQGQAKLGEVSLASLHEGENWFNFTLAAGEEWQV